jgi:hypothetical protein
MFNRSVESTDRYFEILHTCLEQVSTGQEPLDSILYRYPDLIDLLKPPLEAAIWLVARSKSFDPRPDFVKISRSCLVNRMLAECTRNHWDRRMKIGIASGSTDPDLQILYENFIEFSHKIAIIKLVKSV